MTPTEWIGLAVTGYLSVPLASLAARKNWPTAVRFLLAFGLGWAVAVGGLALSGEPFTWVAVSAAFGTAFAAQQLTWHLPLPGAGSPGLNEALLSAGSP